MVCVAVLALGACDGVVREPESVPTSASKQSPARVSPSRTQSPGPAATASSAPTEATTPRIVWRRQDLLGDCCPLGARVAVGNADTAFLAAGHDGDTITALDAADGTNRWTTTLDTDSVFVGAADDSMLLVHGQHGWFVGLTPATGTRRWRREVGARDAVIATTLLDRVAVLTVSTPSEGDPRAPYVLAVNTDDGGMIWRTDLDHASEAQWGAPVIAGEIVLVQTTPDHPAADVTNRLHALGLRDGSIRWQTDLGGSQGFFSAPPVVAGDVVLARGGTRLHAVRISDGSVAWSVARAFPLWAQPDGAAVVEVGGRLATVDAASGERTRRGGVIAAPRVASIAPGLAAEHAVVASRDAVHAFDTRSGERIWQLPTARAPGALAITASRIVVVLTDGTVMAASMPAE